MVRHVWVFAFLAACSPLRAFSRCGAQRSPDPAEQCAVDGSTGDGMDAFADVMQDVHAEEVQGDAPLSMDVVTVDATDVVDVVREDVGVEVVLDVAPDGMTRCADDAGAIAMQVPRAICSSMEQPGTVSVRLVLPSELRSSLRVELLGAGLLVPSSSPITSVSDAGETSVELRIAHTDPSASPTTITAAVALLRDSCELARVPLRVHWAGRRCRGAQDLSFGRERDLGKAFAVTTSCPVGYGIDLQPGPNNSWLVAGSCHIVESRLTVFSGYEPSEDSALWKFSEDGSLDGAFGLAGVARLPLGVNSSGTDDRDRFAAVRPRSDGNILVGGEALSGDDFQATLSLFDSMGRVSPSFSMGDSSAFRGAVLRGVVGTQRNESIRTLSGTREDIVALGDYSLGTECGISSLPASLSTGFARVTSGAIPSVGAFTRLETESRYGYFLVLDSLMDRAGKVVVVGTRIQRSNATDCRNTADTFVARYELDAMGGLSLDTSFATTGLLQFDAGGTLVPGSDGDEHFGSIIQDMDGNYVLAGGLPLEMDRHRPALLRIDASSGSVLSFAAGTMFATAVCGDGTDGRFRDVLRTETGYLAVGYCGSAVSLPANRNEGNTAFLAAFDTMGRLDTSFGSSGRGWERFSLVFGGRPGRSQFNRIHPDSTGFVVLGNFASDYVMTEPRNMTGMLVHFWR